MKFKFKSGPEGVEVSVDGKRLENEVMGIEFKVQPGQLPHVMLVLKAGEVEIDTKAAVTQTREDAPPAAPKAPALPPSKFTIAGKDFEVPAGLNVSVNGTTVLVDGVPYDEWLTNQAPKAPASPPLPAATVSVAAPPPTPSRAVRRAEAKAAKAPLAKKAGK